MTQAWQNVFKELDERTKKARKTGITMIFDKCHGTNAVADHLRLFGPYVDHWKLSFGTSVLLDEGILREKINVMRAHDIIVYPGGTLTEVAMARGVYRDYILRACQLGFNAVEISDGTITMTRSMRNDAINFAREQDLIVIAEVGKKDPDRQPSVQMLADQAVRDFESGVDWVTMEARESGRGIGVFNADGTISEKDVDTMERVLGNQLQRVIWEAPLRKQQKYFIVRFGSNVCLGNISPRDVLGVEAMRAGLRFETFRKVIAEMEPGTAV